MRRAVLVLAAVLLGATSVAPLPSRSGSRPAWCHPDAVCYDADQAAALWHYIDDLEQENRTLRQHSSRWGSCIGGGVGISGFASEGPDGQLHGEYVPAAHIGWTWGYRPGRTQEK